MSSEAGREQAAGEKVGFVQSPHSHLIYTSDGWRLRNPFAGSGGVGRFFPHKIMTGIAFLSSLWRKGQQKW